MAALLSLTCAKPTLGCSARRGSVSRVTNAAYAPRLRLPAAERAARPPCRYRRQPGAAASGASAATATTSAAADAAATQLPRSPAAMVDQAAAAVQAGLDAGRTRQTITLLLPVNEKEADFNNIEPLDYPCSLQKEFDTVCALTKSLMQRLLGAETQIKAKRIDEGGVEGEPCGVLFDEAKSFLAVVYPTSDRLKQLQSYAKEAGRPLLIVNPQWNNAGQVISDFGIGPWRKAADDFLATFEPTYCLKEKRIGSPGSVDVATGTRFVSGGVIRLLRRYPGQYESHAMAPNGSSQLLETAVAEPGYKDMDGMITRGRKAKMEIFALAQKVSAFSFGSDEGSEEDGEEAAAAGADVAGAGGEASSSAELGGLTDADIEAMDASSLRRLLVARGLPTSGKMSKLRERLREVRDA